MGGRIQNSSYTLLQRYKNKKCIYASPEEKKIIRKKDFQVIKFHYL